MDNKTNNNTERIFLEQIVAKIIREERKSIHKRLSSMTDEEFVNDWLDILIPMFGLDNINNTIEKTMRAKGITQDSPGYKSIVHATYQAYTIKGIAYFQELLAVNKQKSDAGEIMN